MTEPISRPVMTELDGFSRMQIQHDTDAENYKSLEETIVHKDPMKQFKVWFDKAVSLIGDFHARMMTLATVSIDGKATARMLRLVKFTEEGFLFTANYNSPKAIHIAKNPYVTLISYWGELGQCVRIEGIAEKTVIEEYYADISQNRKISKHISDKQSVPVESRQTLMDIAETLRKKYGDDIPKAESLGAYVIKPESVEFFQVGSIEINDRLRFRKRKNDTNSTVNDKHLKNGENGWCYETLTP